MPLDSLFANPEQFISRRNGVLARLAGPLATRNRNITEFYVEPNDPWKAYSPGEMVRGCVVLTVSKPVAITHLVICLHGHARVRRNQVAPGDGVATSGFQGPGRGSRGTEYLGNGFASLFEDEVVLCGQGLLRKGIYQFKFDVAFPAQGLPSSLDFERGTISYFLTATLTRPTTIAPTLTCDRRLLFQDTIDVGYVPMPKPRVISLEPVSKRSKMKAKMMHTSQDQVPEPSSSAGSRSLESSQGRSSEHSLTDGPPSSPAPSSKTSTSADTTSSQSFQVVHHPPSTGGESCKNGESQSGGTSKPSGDISASVQLLKAGVLPGDVVPLRITVNHTKPNVRGLVIVTLYRQGRVDMHPAIPLMSKGKGKGKGPEFEDIYPRSRTGLGGLHFSNNAHSSLFRKDLCQMSAMMVVDPQTLTADVRTSLRIPEDVFPTMVNVPGGMIEFKYYVEIVMDLCGQLGESRFLPRISLTSPMQIFTNTHSADSGLQVTGRWADNILDTAQLRRGKNVVVTLLEVVVGSTDSTRLFKKSRHETDRATGRPNEGSESVPPWTEDRSIYQDRDHDEEHESIEGRGECEARRGSCPLFPRFVPPPEPEEEVDEKTRLRRQEELLLPSQPPDAGESSSSAGPAIIPSAPFIAEEEAFYVNPSICPPGNEPSGPEALETAISTHSTDTTIPPYSQRPGSRINGDRSYGAIDDKGEAERQRLMMEASAPPPAHADDGSQAAGPAAAPPIDADGPSAPIITEDDEYNAYTLNRDDYGDAGDDSLPQYRR